MIILNVLENIFRILLPISLTISVIDGGKKVLSNSSEKDDERDVTNNKNSKPGWEKNVKLAIILSTI